MVVQKSFEADSLVEVERKIVLGMLLPKLEQGVVVLHLVANAGRVKAVFNVRKQHIQELSEVLAGVGIVTKRVP